MQGVQYDLPFGVLNSGPFDVCQPDRPSNHRRRMWHPFAPMAPRDFVGWVPNEFNEGYSHST